MKTRIPAFRASAAPCIGVSDPARLRAVGEQDDRAGELPVLAARPRLATDDLTTCTATPSPSPIAVPASGESRSTPSCSTPRSVVGIDEHVRPGAEGDEADLHLLRHLLREGVHRVLGRTEAGRLRRRSRASSPRRRRAGRRSPGWRSPTPSPAGGRARSTPLRARAGSSASGIHRRQGASALCGHRREQIEVRERDRVARPPAIEPQRETEHGRHEQQREQEVRRAEAHGAHSAPTWTIGVHVDRQRIACRSGDDAPSCRRSRGSPSRRPRSRPAAAASSGTQRRARRRRAAPTGTRPGRTARCPGPITTIRERNSSEAPGGLTARAETVERPPPPWVGTQPSSGWKSCVRGEVETARKSAYRVVVAPG